MTYEESAALMIDQTFRGRVKVACLKFADSILNEAATVAGHSSRYKWATQTFFQPDMTAQTVTPPTVMDSAVQADGAAISDDALQGAVEAVVGKML